MKHEPSALASITETCLRAQAGERAFARNVAYFESGAVTDVVMSEKTINARVMGGDEYAVQLWSESNALGHACTCPVADGGVFCKHAVAAGLAWLARQQDAPTVRRTPDDLVNQKNKRAYDAVAQLIAKIRNLMWCAKQEKEFAEWLGAVRIKHKAKRNFMQRLDQILAASSAKW